MSKKYKLQLELLLEEENDGKVIEAARRIYGETRTSDRIPR
jgi:hypothetical protein